MKSVFAKTSNVDRFMAGLENIESRGAPEASWMLAAGDSGYGKTRTGEWWAVQHNAILIRIKASATPHWVLTDIVNELRRETPKRSCEQLFAQVVGQMIDTPQPIVLDEVENAVRDWAVLETVRDISDILSVPVILLGREYVAQRLRSQRQIWSRISAVAAFGPATLQDVRRVADEVAEAEIEDAVCERIHEESKGFIRDIVKAISRAERLGLRTKRPVGVADLDGVVLIDDFRAGGQRR
jgi:hypothetical protein